MVSSLVKRMTAPPKPCCAVLCFALIHWASPTAACRYQCVDGTLGHHAKACKLAVRSVGIGLEEQEQVRRLVREHAAAQHRRPDRLPAAEGCGNPARGACSSPRRACPCGLRRIARPVASDPVLTVREGGRFTRMNADVAHDRIDVNADAGPAQRGSHDTRGRSTCRRGA